MIDSFDLARSPAGKQWEKIEIKPHHGIAIPLFSIYSNHSYGIGEFSDIPLLIDWCAATGFDLIQLLPLNDTGWGTSPYGALSAFALNPIHLGLSDLPYIDEIPFLEEELKLMPKFSLTSRVHYQRVRESKEHFLRHYYQVCGRRILKSAPFLKFCQTAFWLKGYAVYKILKKRFNESSWETWPEAYRTPNPEIIDSLSLEEEDEFHYVCLVQYLCDNQMKEAKAHAGRQGILLMGDIPILINRDSADVWFHQGFFDLDYSAGAPPDLFNKDGQNWGFPIYRWNIMIDQGFNWWKERLNWASRYYHVYRLDHVVGFFRIWAIPIGSQGKEGFFIPQDESIWIDHGQKLLMMLLEASDMLPIGEDLGVIPPEVRTCLNALGISGTRVMRWERKWNEDGSYIPLQDYSVDSMTTVSTHDSETLLQWWKNNPVEAKLYAQSKGWSYQPTLSTDHHREILWDSHHTASLFHINPLQEYLRLVPGLSPPDPEEDRINIPGLISPENWSSRLIISLEALAAQSTLKHLMQELIK